MGKMFKSTNTKDTKKDITFAVDVEEYEEANLMAKHKRFDSIEALMIKKYSHILSVYRAEQITNIKEN